MNYGNTAKDAEEIGFRDYFINDFIINYTKTNNPSEVLNIKGIDREETIKVFNKFKDKNDKTIY